MVTHLLVGLVMVVVGGVAAVIALAWGSVRCDGARSSPSESRRATGR
jgi:hypothetical protein